MLSLVRYKRRVRQLLIPSGSLRLSFVRRTVERLRSPKTSAGKQVRKTLLLCQAAIRYPHGAVGLVLVYLIRIVYPIRLGWIMPERIGHFAADVALRFAEREINESLSLDLYCLEPRHPISNQFWLIMLKRNFKVTRLVRPIVCFARRLPHQPTWLLPPFRHLTGSRDMSGNLPRASTTMGFTENETEWAQQWLKSLGWEPGQRIVCLLVRDSVYLNSTPGLRPDDLGKPLDYWDSESYRNSDIADYMSAAHWLADQGAWVFRMGSRMDKPINSAHPRLIDYAFRNDRSDFLDVWLFAHCDFCVTTATGPDVISMVYRKPVLAINMLPLCATWTAAPVVTASKPLYNAAGLRLTLEEHINFRGGMGTPDYIAEGLTWRDLNSCEILDIVQEVWQDITGTRQRSEKDVHDQILFFSLLRNSPDSSLHGFLHPGARISSFWMRNLEHELSLHAKP